MQNKLFYFSCTSDLRTHETQFLSSGYNNILAIWMHDKYQGNNYCKLKAFKVRKKNANLHNLLFRKCGTHKLVNK